MGFKCDLLANESEKMVGWTDSRINWERCLRGDVTTINLV